MLATAVLAGAVAMSLLVTMNPDHHPYWSIGGFILILGVASAYVAAESTEFGWIGPIGILAGLAVGVAVADAFDIYEHNLFPFEIVFVWALAIVPVLLGSLIG